MTSSPKPHESSSLAEYAYVRNANPTHLSGVQPGTLLVNDSDHKLGDQPSTDIPDLLDTFPVMQLNHEEEGPVYISGEETQDEQRGIRLNRAVALILGSWLRGIGALQFNSLRMDSCSAFHIEHNVGVVHEDSGELEIPADDRDQAGIDRWAAHLDETL